MKPLSDEEFLKELNKIDKYFEKISLSKKVDDMQEQINHLREEIEKLKINNEK